jgi:hypothetical protein
MCARDVIAIRKPSDQRLNVLPGRIAAIGPDAALCAISTRAWARQPVGVTFLR